MSAPDPNDPWDVRNPILRGPLAEGDSVNTDRHRPGTDEVRPTGIVLDEPAPPTVRDVLTSAVGSLEHGLAELDVLLKRGQLRTARDTVAEMVKVVAVVRRITAEDS